MSERNQALRHSKGSPEVSRWPSGVPPLCLAGAPTTERAGWPRGTSWPNLVSATKRYGAKSLTPRAPNRLLAEHVLHIANFVLHLTSDFFGYAAIP
jgi:hypothetical protein